MILHPTMILNICACLLFDAPIEDPTAIGGRAHSKRLLIIYGSTEIHSACSQNVPAARGRSEYWREPRMVVSLALAATIHF